MIDSRASTRPRAAAALALLSLLPATAGAGPGDAGTQSYFATGTGARALGMGSAFTAAADDATALFWNPAGLAGARRLEFQALQWSDGALGFRETNASFVLPDWRWGAAGASLRLFGVDGLERRSDDNQAGESFSDTELEAMLGYARPIGEAWDVGGTLKLVRHDLAGFSSAGFGADLGVRVRPARLFGAGARHLDGVTVGLAVRNAMQPMLRLDAESVPDPGAVRGGVAWTLPAAGFGRVTGALDLERPRDAGTRARAGFEWLPLAGVAMRAGLRSSGMTAGAGFAWNACGLDYVFEESPLGARHRVGLSWKLGRTVEERRVAALAAEDARLRQQIAETHQRLLDGQTRELVTRIEASRAAGQTDAALETVGWLATLAPDHPERIRLEHACLIDKAARLEASGDFAGAGVTYERAHTLAPGDTVAAGGAARCMEQSRLRASRSSERQRLYAQALSAFAGDDLATSRARLGELLALQPDDADGLALLAWTRQAARTRLARALEESERLASAGQFAEADAVLAAARALDPSSPELSRLAQGIARRRDAALVQGAEAARAARPEPSLSPAEAVDLYERGLNALRAQRSDEAIRYLELVWNDRPDFRETGSLLKRELLARGLALFAAGRLEEAVDRWTRARQVDPADPRIRAYLERGRKELARTREILGPETAEVGP